MKSIYGHILGLAYLLSSLDFHKAFNVVEKHLTPIPENTLKQNFKHNKTFYQNNFINENKSYYNRGIPRNGKKTRGKYISIQCEARHRRQKIRKTLEKKI